MPFLKTLKKKHSCSKSTDTKAHQRGLHQRVFSVNGDEYIGEWQDSKKHGKGTQVWKKSGAIYSGEWKFGKCDGYGTYSVLLPDAKEYTRKYCGDWKDGKKHGQGTYFYSTSAVYEGEWSEGLRNGWGRMHDEGGEIYEGEWRKDKKHGQGIMQFANGNWYEGSWRDGQRNGNGKFYHADKGRLYEGFWVDDVAKCGTLSDFGREEAPHPPKYPIPEIKLVDMQMVLREARSAYPDDHHLQQDKNPVSAAQQIP